MKAAEKMAGAAAAYAEEAKHATSEEDQVGCFMKFWVRLLEIAKDYPHVFKDP